MFALQTKMLSEHVHSMMGRMHLVRAVRKMLCRLVLYNQLKLLHVSCTAKPFSIVWVFLYHLFEVCTNFVDAELL